MIKFLLLATILSTITGTLGLIPLNFPMVNFYLVDLCVLITFIFSVFRWKKKYLEGKVAMSFLIFMAISFLSWAVSAIPMSVYERGVALLYPLRFALYFSLYLTVRMAVAENLLLKDDIKKTIVAAGCILVLGGWIQYLIYPDLRNLYYSGWDPHYKRIFSSILDPNYLGIMLVLFMITLFSVKNSKANIILKIIAFITIAFTYSRSTYLSLITAAGYFLKSKKFFGWFAAVCILLLVTSILLPRPGGEGVNLGRIFSITERISNWGNAFYIYAHNPVFGAGANTLRFTYRKYFHFRSDWLTSHSAAGVDNSFLYVAATTGTPGLISYLALLFFLFKTSGIWGKISLTAVAVHSLFLNTLFFPFVMVWLFIALGCDRIKVEP